MSESTKAMRDFLTKSPSMVFPDEVLELFKPVEAENRKLRELVRDMWPSYCYANGGNGETYLAYEQDVAMRGRIRNLGVLGE